MTQYDDVLAFFGQHPGAARSDLSRSHPRITHEHEILSRAVSIGALVREKVPGTYRGVWGYWTVGL